MALARAQVEPQQPRFTTIGGRVAQVVQVPRFLPPRLDALLAGLLVVERLPRPTLAGFSVECADTDHRLMPWLRGAYAGRELALLTCTHCGAVEVRDVSLDLLPGLRSGHTAPRRRNAVLGWYSGKRRAGRVYL